MKVQNTLVSNIRGRSQRYFAHVTTVSLSWRVQYIVVIGRAYSKLEHFEFSSNFEFDRNMLSGTGARAASLAVLWCAWIQMESNHNGRKTTRNVSTNNPFYFIFQIMENTDCKSQPNTHCSRDDTTFTCTFSDKFSVLVLKVFHSAHLRWLNIHFHFCICDVITVAYMDARSHTGWVNTKLAKYGIKPVVACPTIHTSHHHLIITPIPTPPHSTPSNTHTYAHKHKHKHKQTSGTADQLRPRLISKRLK